MLADLPDALKGLADLERGVMRILHGTSAPAELVGTLHAIGRTGPVLCRSGGSRMPGGFGGSDADGGIGGIASPLLQRLLQAVTSEEVGCRQEGVTPPPSR